MTTEEDQRRKKMADAFKNVKKKDPDKEKAKAELTRSIAKNKALKTALDKEKAPPVDPAKKRAEFKQQMKDIETKKKADKDAAALKGFLANPTKLNENWDSIPIAEKRKAYAAKYNAEVAKLQKRRAENPEEEPLGGADFDMESINSQWGEDAAESKLSATERLLVKTGAKTGRGVNRALDIASRPKNALVSTVLAANTADKSNKSVATDLKSIGGGFWKGLSGKEKKGWGEWIDRHTDNKALINVGGLALDLVADPVNKTGFKAIRGSTAAEKALIVGSNLEKAVDVQSTAAKVAKAAGTKVAPYTEFIEKAEQAGIAAAKTAKGNQIGIRYGTKVGVIPGSEALLKGVSKSGEWFRNTSVGANFTKTFNNNLFEVGGKIFKDSDRVGHLARKTLSGGIDEVDKTMSSITETFKTLTSAEKKQVSHAIQQGKTRYLKDVPVEGDPTKSLGDFADLAQTYSKKLFDDEVSAGLRKADEYDPTYLYQHYNQGSVGQIKAFKDGRNSARNAASKSRQTGFAGDETSKFVEAHGLDAAKKSGLAPTEEIDNVLKQHVAKSYSKVGETAIRKNVVDTFGVKLDTTAAKAAEKHGLVSVGDGYYVHKNIKDTIDYLSQLRANPIQAKKMVGTLAQINDLWKLNVTVLNPGHHVNNAIGDIFNNYMVGVKNPKSYKQSLAAIKGGAGAQQKVRIGDRTLTLEEAFKEYTLSGARAGRAVVENSESVAKGTLAGKILEKAKPVREFSSKREDFSRFAHWLDVAKREGATAMTNKGTALERNMTPFQRASIKAADSTIHVLHDYSDLTDAEKKLRSGIIPFYTWMRKNSPRMLEMLVTHPGQFMATEKIKTSFEQMINPNQENFENIKSPWQKNMISVAKNVSDMSNTLATFGTPNEDLLKTLDSPVEGLKNMLAGTGPMINTPLGLKTGSDPAFGYKIKDTSDFLVSQIGGPIAKVAKVLNPETSKEAKRLELIKFLTGARVSQSEPKTKKVIVQQENAEMVKKLRENREKKRNALRK
jgi:hypothetical protein